MIFRFFAGELAVQFHAINVKIESRSAQGTAKIPTKTKIVINSACPAFLFYLCLVVVYFDFLAIKCQYICNKKAIVFYKKYHFSYLKYKKKSIEREMNILKYEKKELSAFYAFKAFGN